MTGPDFAPVSAPKTDSKLTDGLDEAAPLARLTARTPRVIVTAAAAMVPVKPTDSEACRLRFSSPDDMIGRSSSAVEAHASTSAPMVTPTNVGQLVLWV